MNMLGKKLNCKVTHWEPFATSTPLKPVSTDPNVKFGICPVRPSAFASDSTQKNLYDSKIFRNERPIKSKIKILGTNRSKAYFDISSSSDDDCDLPVEKSRPVIKINSETSKNIKLVPVNGKFNVGISHSRNCSSITKEFSKTKYIKGKNKNKERNRISNRPVKFDSGLENVSVNGNNKTNVAISVKNLPLENKSLCMTSKVFPKCKKEKKLIKSKIPVLEVNDDYHKNNKNSKRSLIKRKHTEINPVKKRRHVEAGITENQHMLRKTIKQANSSHQLFTDSTQEQLINSLCMSTPEGEELSRNKESLNKKPDPIKGTVKNKVIKQVHSIKCDVGISTNSPISRKRPQRTREAPKKFWLVNDKHKSVGINDKKCVKQCESIQPVNTLLTNHSLVPEKVTSVTAITTKKKEVLADQIDVINTQNQEVKKPEPEPEAKTAISLRTRNKVLLDTKTENLVEHPVFLPLSEVSFLENEFGQQVSQVCEIKNFKCGIFKLKPGSTFTWKKSQRNNYMGGVLINGKMSMTIGGKEHILKEGDMVVVPPCSTCQTTNIGSSDFIFYYWCNKFKK